MKNLRKYGLHAAAIVALAAVFSLYTRPEFLMGLANQIWACF
jgi:hypothetical protein